MKKILILANIDMGLYNFRKELLQTLIAQGNEVYISLPMGPRVKDMEEMGCKFIETPVDRRGMNPIADLKLFFGYRKILKQLKPDVVLTYTIKPNIYGGLACRMAKVPYLSNITGLGSAFQQEGFLKKLVHFLYRIALKRANTVVFENEGNQDLFLQQQIVTKSQAQLMKGAGVNLEEYRFCEYPRIQENIVFLFIGRIMKEKGVDELFSVARRIHQEGANAEFHFIGFYEEDYKDEIEELEQTGIIRFFGYQQDVKPFIRNAHCFVLPSYHEGMANTLLENASMGRPLITSDIFGCREAVSVGENGFLCKRKDRDSLYFAVQSFLNLSHEEKAMMGKKSRELMEREFDRNGIVSHIGQLVNDMMSEMKS